MLHILNEIRYSGAEIMLYDAKDYFDSHNIEGYVLGRTKEIGAYAPVLEKVGYTIYHKPAVKTIGGFYDLYKFLKRQHFDVVHVHPESLYLWHCLVIKLAFPSARIIRTFHDVFFHYTPLMRQVRRLHRYICREWVGVKGVSIGESVHSVEKEFFNNDSAIIYNWIDEKEFRPPTPEEISSAKKEIGIPDGAFVLLTVGTCNDKKRHNDIFEAIARVKDKIPNVIFLHRGSGPNQEKENEYVKKLGIESNVIFLHYIDYLPKVFWASDAFIFSSKWEGLGNVILQAIACEVPVILYDGWGMNDFKPGANDGNYGFWLNPKTQQFDEAILALHQKKETGEINEWKKNARTFYLKKFSYRQSLAKMVSVYLD